MRMLPGFRRNLGKKSVLAASSLLFLLATETVAQSGRRAPKPAQPPVNTPQTDTESTSRTGARELKKAVSLLVTRDTSSKHLRSEDAIFKYFLDHLAGLTNVTATPIGDSNRSLAVKRARNETEALVVLLEFDVDEFQSGTIILNAQDLDIRVLVFEPKTGKKRFEGKVYYQAVGGPMLKRDNWPNGTPIRITTEGVGIEAAEQVLDWLIVQEIRQK